MVRVDWLESNYFEVSDQRTFQALPSVPESWQR